MKLQRASACAILVALLGTSGILATTGQASAAPPKAPAAPSVSNWGTKSITIQWAVPSGSSSQEVRYKESGSNSAKVIGVSKSTTVYSVGGLTHGVNYQFRVRGTNSSGGGAWSDTTTWKAGYPGKINTVVANPGNRSAQVRWTRSQNLNAIKGYKINVYRGASLIKSQTTPYRDEPTHTATIPGLINGTAYTFRVQGSNEYATTPWSPSSNAVTPVSVPGAPSNLILTPGNERIDASWSAPSDNGGLSILGYNVQIQRGDDPTWADIRQTSATSLEFPNLVNGVSVRVRVQARNANGSGVFAVSNYVTPVSPPQPQGLTVTSGVSTLKIGWNAGASNTTPVSGYEAQLSCNSGVSWKSTTVPASARSATFAGLPGGSACLARVRALAHGADASSEWEMVTRTSAPLSIPAPATPTASNLRWSGSSAIVNLTVPTNATSIQVRTASGSSTSFGSWRKYSKNTKSLRYASGSSGKTIQVRACTELCSTTTTVVAKLGKRNTRASKRLPQITGTITRGTRQSVFFRNSASVQWRVYGSTTRVGGKWRTGKLSRHIAKPGMSFQVRTKNKIATGTIRVLANGTYSGVVKGR